MLARQYLDKREKAVEYLVLKEEAAILCRV